MGESSFYFWTSNDVSAAESANNDSDNKIKNSRKLVNNVVQWYLPENKGRNTSEDLVSTHDTHHIRIHPQTAFSPAHTILLASKVDPRFMR